MSERERRDLSGVLFKNDRKQSDNHSDYRGTCLINGVEYYMDAWLKDGQKGKFMSFSFKPKNGVSNAKPQQAPAKQTGWEDRLADDVIPF